MRAMLLDQPGRPLRLSELPRGTPGPGEILVRVAACGVCRTDLHICDGDLAFVRAPIVPGHEIVGRVEAAGDGVSGIAVGWRVGIPWLGWTCGRCGYCATGRDTPKRSTECACIRIFIIDSPGSAMRAKAGGFPPIPNISTSWRYLGILDLAAMCSVTGK